MGAKTSVQQSEMKLTYALQTTVSVFGWWMEYGIDFIQQKNAHTTSATLRYTQMERIGFMCKSTSWCGKIYSVKCKNEIYSLLLK